MSTSYEHIRHQYKPQHISLLLIAESPPPSAEIQSSRHFYRSEKIRTDDRLFTNTIWALYPETTTLSESELEAQKKIWLERLQSDGVYMIEALEVSQRHSITKVQRQERIRVTLPQLIQRVRSLAQRNMRIILIKSNVFDVAAQPLRDAGFQVLNQELVDYPGHFNQKAYREKLASLVAEAKP